MLIVGEHGSADMSHTSLEAETPVTVTLRQVTSTLLKRFMAMPG
jgi:hypothetical protein